MKTITILILMTLTLISCAHTTSEDLKDISVGMDQRQVKDVLGNPESVYTQDNQMIYTYLLREEKEFPLMLHIFTFGMLNGMGDDRWYAVRFRDNFVDAYGRVDQLVKMNKESEERQNQVQNPVTNTINIGTVNKGLSE